MPPLVPGRYYSMLATGSGGSSTTITGPRLVVTPFYIAESTNVDQLSVRRSGATLVTATLGIYGPMLPAISGTPLIVSGAQMTLNANGTWASPISATLAPGWYLLAVAYSANWNTEVQGSTTGIGLLGRDAANGEAGYYHARWDGVYEPLPSTLPNSPTFGVSGTPLVTLRAA